ncbi:hypothetical protein DM860_000791 [Cuscuta australis]|uniref:RRM domain-containing protein n=1 Tax=Cuscuta australis TaxID=267555 RepID=A0A328CX68_9ASTE|nr:hypothetical protein DM860_000791 [Cuscuta australis]
MASTTLPLHFLSLSPKSLPLSKPNGAAAAAVSSRMFCLPYSSSVSRAFSLSCPVAPFRSPRGSRTVPRVAFADEIEDALDDVEEVDGVEDEGEDEDLGSGGSSYSYSNEPRFPSELRLFVGNLPFSVESATLANLFGEVGNVEVAEVIYDKQSGRSRGFGFVTMSTVEEAEAAVQQLNGYELEGRELRVNSGPPPPKRESSFRGSMGGGSGRYDNTNRLYVGNLSWGVDDEALENLFSEQGKVKEARVVYDRESGRSKGFGFVTYTSAEEVNNAIESLDGADLNGRPIRVSVAESRPRQF